MISDPNPPRDSTFDRGLYGGAVAFRRAKGKNRGAIGATLLDPYGDDDATQRFRAWVDADGPLEIDLGFGRGGFLLERAAQVPHSRLVGFEVRTQHCMEVMDRLERHQLSNVRIIQADARPVIDCFFKEASISCLFVGFPDPWWKKRHHKRRIFSPEFVDMLHGKLISTGSVILRTDVADYADNVREVFQNHGGFVMRTMAPNELPWTDRERRCEDYGLPVHRYHFAKVA